MGGVDADMAMVRKEIQSVGVEAKIARRMAPLPSCGFVITFITLLAGWGHWVLAAMGISRSWGWRAMKGEGGVRD